MERRSYHVRSFREGPYWDYRENEPVIPSPLRNQYSLPHGWTEARGSHNPPHQLTVDNPPRHEQERDESDGWSTLESSVVRSRSYSSPATTSDSSSKRPANAADQILPDSFGAPIVELNGNPGWFVVSLKFVQNRSLASLVRSYYPEARWVETDFDDPDMLSELGLPSRCSDVQMVVSPKVALMTTTLAQLHQPPPPLPGDCMQPNLLSTQDASSSAAQKKPIPDPMTHVFVDFARVVRTYPFFRRTILLVSQGLPASAMKPVKMTRADKKALQDLRGNLRALGLDKAQETGPEAKLQFCAGGERELAKWVVAMMVLYGDTSWTPGDEEGWTEGDELSVRNVEEVDDID